MYIDGYQEKQRGGERERNGRKKKSMIGRRRKYSADASIQ
jgi:hypothetical protein